MKEVIENIKIAENDAREKIESAKKRLASELSAAQEKCGELRKQAETEGENIVGISLIEAEKRALADSEKVRGSQKETISKLAVKSSKKSGKIVDEVVAEFGKWR
jgi:V/A-type H+/Na+-transporting ATPase subunit G/H